MSKPLNYTDDVNLAWATIAVDKFTVTPLPTADDPVKLRLQGRCPRCNEPMEHTHNLIAFSGVAAMTPETLHATVKSLRSAGVIEEKLLPAEFSVKCCCRSNHPDRLGRSGLTGCGAIWKMRIESVDEAAR